MGCTNSKLSKIESKRTMKSPRKTHKNQKKAKMTIQAQDQPKIQLKQIETQDIYKHVAIEEDYIEPQKITVCTFQPVQIKEDLSSIKQVLNSGMIPNAYVGFNTTCLVMLQVLFPFHILIIISIHFDAFLGQFIILILNFLTMARRSRSPLKYIANINPQVDQRQVIIRKLKEQLAFAHERQKQMVILQSYLVSLHEKAQLLQTQKAKAASQQKIKIESVQRVINDLKKQIEIYKNQIRNVNSQLLNANDDFDDLKKLKNNREIEIDKWKKQTLILQEEHQLLFKEMAQLNNQHEIVLHQNQRFVITLHDLEDRFAQVNSKIAEVKKYLQQLYLEQKQYKERLKKYEMNNNNISENIANKEDNIDRMEEIFQMKHDQIKNNIQHYIELQHADDKVKRQIVHVHHLIKNENEKNNQLSSLIQRNDKINQIKDIGIQSAQIEMANREISQQNDLMKRDMTRCQQHLQNLLKQNLYLQQSMDNYIRQDQAIINIITRKVTPYMKSNSRRRTGF